MRAFIKAGSGYCTWAACPDREIRSGDLAVYLGDGLEHAYHSLSVQQMVGVRLTEDEWWSTLQ